MARYDRIAPLSAPVRERVFTGWTVLRDLDGNRDADPGRRAKLRFMAFRALHRLIEHGILNVPLASFERQLDAVQEELGLLSPRDPERIQLATFLHRLRERTPAAAAEAAVAVGAFAEGRGHNHAAREFYAAALDAAVRHALTAERVQAQLRLGGLAIGIGAAGAEAALDDALAASSMLPDESLRIEVLEALSSVEGARAAAARDELAALAARGSSLEVRARAAAARARIEMSAGRVERALEVCWHSFIALSDSAQRTEAARTLASALSRMGQIEAADRSLQHATPADATPATALRLRIDAACNAGYAHLAGEFGERRADVLPALEALRIESVFYADAHLDLAEAALDCQNVDSAREHLRQAIDAARQSHRAAALARAETLLSRLEQPSTESPSIVPDERGVARRIATAIAALAEPLATAGS